MKLDTEFKHIKNGDWKFTISSFAITTFSSNLPCSEWPESLKQWVNDPTTVIDGVIFSTSFLPHSWQLWCLISYCIHWEILKYWTFEGVSVKNSLFRSHVNLIVNSSFAITRGNAKLRIILPLFQYLLRVELTAILVSNYVENLLSNHHAFQCSPDK